MLETLVMTGVRSPAALVWNPALALTVTCGARCASFNYFVFRMGANSTNLTGLL